MTLQSVRCTNCDGYNTATHYSHNYQGQLHVFVTQNLPPAPAVANGPLPQDCPINGCYNAGFPLVLPGPSNCLECGNIL
jgi:hypothetical protein